MANEVRASHILVGSEQEARDLKKRIDEGEDFDTVARHHSQCPSGQAGGDLGFFGKGMMVPEFEQAAFSAQKDQCSDPVKTQFGYHLIKVTEER